VHSYAWPVWPRQCANMLPCKCLGQRAPGVTIGGSCRQACEGHCRSGGDHQINRARGPASGGM